MKTLRPVSMQRIRGALDMQHLDVEVGANGSWMVRTPTHVLTANLEDPNVLHFKVTSTRRFSDVAAMIRLRQHTNALNQATIGPKAYVEKVGETNSYTVSAEVSRLVKSGLSELQFSAWTEECVHILYSFIADLETKLGREGVGNA